MTDIIIAAGSPTGIQPAGSYNVMDSGAHGNGIDDDRQHILDAITAAGTAAVYFPAGTYLLSSELAVPSGTDFVGGYALGPSSPTAWLKGKFSFGSNSTFTDLKIGDENKMVEGTHGGTSAYTSFTRCHFRGGGGSLGDHAPLGIGWDADCSNLTFTNCEVECSLGSEDAAKSNGRNCIALYSGTNGTVNDITFDGCHVGVSNGVRSGSLRMGLEAYTGSAAWSDITVRDCVFEVCDVHGLDFADGSGMESDGFTVEGCTIKGGGLNLGSTAWGYSICVECPTGGVIQNNTIGYGNRWAMMFSTVYSPSTRPRTHLHGNTFDFDTDNGVTRSAYQGFFVNGDGIEITGNDIVFTGSSADYVFQFTDSSNCVVTGNTIEMGDKDMYVEYNTNTNNTYTPNTFV